MKLEAKSLLAALDQQKIEYKLYEGFHLVG